jgi:DNA-binding GntR family transcriptional regulator
MKSSNGSGPQVYDLLRDMAVNFHFRPGQRIKESEIARQLSMSRTPVREALGRLASEGLLSFEPNRGFTSRELDHRETLELHEVRECLEARAFRLACAHAEADEIAGLREFWREIARRKDGLAVDELVEADEAFHLRLAALGRNRELLRMLESINARIRFIRRIEIQRPQRRETTFSEHEEILRCLDMRAVGKGTKMLSSHISLSAEDALNAVKDGLCEIFLGDRQAMDEISEPS